MSSSESHRSLPLGWHVRDQGIGRKPADRARLAVVVTCFEPSGRGRRVGVAGGSQSTFEREFNVEFRPSAARGLIVFDANEHRLRNAVCSSRAGLTV